MTTETAWDGRRADARRNHERVLAAAIEVFTEHGLDATIPQVAERAGVGKATVYRSYPTKADLVRALAQTHVEILEALAAEALQDSEQDAFGAMSRFLAAAFTRLAEDRLMVEVLKGGHLPEDERAKDGDEFFEHMLRFGITQGTIRRDATARDVQVLVSGCARALIELGERDPAVWRRYAGLAMAALRP